MSGSVDGRSKLLFNNSHVLSVAAAISNGDPVVDSGSLQKKLGLRQSAVHRVLVMLEGADLVERLERKSRTEPLRYQRLPHSFWAAVTELADA